MTRVIIESSEIAILEDEQGKFMYSQTGDIIEIPDQRQVPILNHHANYPVMATATWPSHREVRAMLS